MQDELGAIGLTQVVLTSGKSPGLVPAIEAFETVRLLVPELVRVKFCWADVDPLAWLPKLMDAGARVTAGATPVTLRLATKGLPVALAATVKVPFRTPVATGVEVTLMTQLAPPAKEAGQLLV